MRVSIALCLTFAVVGCDDASAPDAAVPVDAGPADAGAPDAGPEPAVEPDLYCPGQPTCDGEVDGLLYAGAAAVPITPSLDDAEPLIVDMDGDGQYEPADGDVFEDENDNGIYDAIWLAGFGNNRAATEILHDVFARAVALRHDETTIVFVSLDVVGFFLDDADAVRERTAELPVDYVAVSATHVHEARDTIGIWGRTLSESGRSAEYMDFVYTQAAEAVRLAVEDLRRAHVQYASTRLEEQPGGTFRYVGDSRDPVIIDDELRILRFVEPTGETIATVVNGSAHPEYMGSRNTRLSADYVHWLREGVELGVTDPSGASVPGLGGTCVFINGALGAQIGPGRTHLETWDGTPVSGGTLEAASTVGSQLAYFVLAALGPDGGSTTEETAPLGFRRHRFFLTIENQRYHLAFLQNLFAREVYNYDPDLPVRLGSNLPDVLTEIAVIDVGRATMIAFPGELDPALFVGGYDGAYTPEGVLLVDEALENPPNLDLAPPPPYLRDLARADADQVWLLGLTNDFLGYFIPDYDYQLHPSVPYILEADGDHYEETNSIGERAWGRVEDKLTQLLAWTP